MRPTKWCTSRKELKGRRSRKQVCEIRAESEAGFYRSFVVHINSHRDVLTTMSSKRV